MIMRNNRLIMRYLQRAAFISVTASVLMLAGSIKAEAAGRALSCSISPDGGITTVGVAIRFSGMTQGGKGSKSYSWDFSDGEGVPSVSTDNNVDVIYNTAGGPFAVLLDVTDKQGTSASCSTTVTVTNGGGGNTPLNS